MKNIDTMRMNEAELPVVGMLELKLQMAIHVLYFVLVFLDPVTAMLSTWQS